MRTFIIAAVAGICLLTGCWLSAGAGKRQAKIEKGKGELKGDLEEMKGETKAMKEELKGNDTKAEMERAKGKIKSAANGPRGR